MQRLVESFALGDPPSLKSFVPGNGFDNFVICRYTQQMAEDRIVMDYAFNESAVAVTSVQAGRTHTSSLPAVSDQFTVRLRAFTLTPSIISQFSD